MTRKLLIPSALLAAVVATGISLQPVSAGPPAPNGEALFRQRCSMCHSVVPSQPKALGPALNGVVGRKAAATTFRYSPALAASGVTWSKANLDRFLAGPARMVPGTRMVIAVSDPAQRSALIGYLETRK